MNVGLLTDTHYGAVEENPTEALDSLIQHFREENVTTVVHLGDVGKEIEQTADETYNYIESIFTKLEEFDTYLLRGNHDVQNFSPEQLEDIPGLDNCVTGTERLTGSKTNDEMLLVETATVLNGHPVGYIPDETLDTIISFLSDDSIETHYLLSHYPLQYTDYYQQRPFFKTQPEYAFPINKPLLNIELHKNQDTINTNTIHCISGHLHPPTEYTTQTDPYNIQLTIKEAVTGFEEADSGELVFFENTTLNPDDFVYTL